MSFRQLIPLLFVACAGAPEPLTTTEHAITLGPPESRALAVVRVPTPWWAPKFMVTRRFIAAIPEYAAAPQLEQKSFTMAADGRFGGVYLWASRPAAESWFDAAWHERVRQARGVDGDVRILDAKWTVAGDTVATGRELPQHGLKTDAIVTWFMSTAPADAIDARERSLAAAHGIVPGLVRTSLVSDAEGHVGAVDLWASRDAAERFWTASRQTDLAKTVGTSADLTWFSAPVLLDVAAAQRDGAQP